MWKHCLQVWKAVGRSGSLVYTLVLICLANPHYKGKIKSQFRFCLIGPEFQIKVALVWSKFHFSGSFEMNATSLLMILPDFGSLYQKSTTCEVSEPMSLLPLLSLNILQGDRVLCTEGFRKTFLPNRTDQEGVCWDENPKAGYSCCGAGAEVRRKCVCVCVCVCRSGGMNFLGEVGISYFGLWFLISQ
jgi:hypothetical protein